MGIAASIIGVIVFFVTTSLGLALIVPFVGIVVRFRVNYNPRALNLGPTGDSIGVPVDAGEDARVVGPKVTSLLGMFLRVRRIEGWSGLYKGFMPLWIFTAFNTLLSILLMGTSPHAKGHYTIPKAGLLQSLFYALVLTFVSLPFGIIVNRAITTPHKLPSFGLRTSLRLLLTEYERRRPWVLYATPGLLGAQALHVVFVSLVFRVVRLVLVPALAGGLDRAEKDGSINSISTIRLSIFILFQALVGTAILSPLEVMSERLSIQRNYTPGAEFEEEDAEVALAQAGEAGVEYMGKGEDVLNLRSSSGEEPYKSLRHCMHRIVEEEGVGTLFRAWWLTMLGAVLSGLA